MNPITRERIRAAIMAVVEEHPNAPLWDDESYLDDGEEKPMDKLLRRIETILQPSPGL